MCLTVTVNFSTKNAADDHMKYRARTADRDIEVYKRLHKKAGRGRPTFWSPYQLFQYRKGDHFYQDGEPFTYRVCKSFGSSVHRIEIDQGLHSWINRCFAGIEDSTTVIVKMIIPKGSKYFLGRDGDVVSDNLIWI